MNNERTYDYKDEQGNIRFQVVHCANKKFAQRRPDGGGGWIWNMKGVTRVLYRVPELIASAANNRIVYVDEGEKDVETIRGLRKVAVCNPGGAGKWHPEFNHYFAKRKVVVIADEDEAGIRHAEKVARSLAPVVRWVKLVRLPGQSVGQDVSDFLKKNSPEELWKIVKSTAKYRSATEQHAASGNDADRPNRLRFQSAAEISKGCTKEVPWIVRGFIALGCTKLLIGPVKAAGKTTFLTHLAKAVLGGKQFLGACTVKIPVVYLSEQPPNSFVQAVHRANGAEKCKQSTKHQSRVQTGQQHP